MPRSRGAGTSRREYWNIRCMRPGGLNSNPKTCPWGWEHLPIVVYHRQWYAPWRIVMVLRCWTCDLRIEEP